jgi:hypothetical protein
MEQRCAKAKEPVSSLYIDAEKGVQNAQHSILMSRPSRFFDTLPGEIILEILKNVTDPFLMLFNSVGVNIR